MPNVDPQYETEEFDDVPRVRWSPSSHRMEYFSPIAAHPGKDGFMLLHHFKHADSYGVTELKSGEQSVLKKMDAMNASINDMENAEKLHFEIDQKRHDKKQNIRRNQRASPTSVPTLTRAIHSKIKMPSVKSKRINQPMN